jgi:hypothetical protein
MLLEGIAEFHQRSVWIFKSSSASLEVARTEYVFPLITPALVREHHLLITEGNRSMKDFADGVHYLPFLVDEVKEGKKVYNVLTPKSNTMALINVMTTSAEAHDAVQNIKIDIRLAESAFGPAEEGVYLRNVVYDLSKLDRLAVHRRLRTFEVSVQLEAEGPTFWAMRLKKAVNHLMTELNIVAEALVPGGVVTQTDLEEQWASYDGQISVPFELTMEKA